MRIEAAVLLLAGALTAAAGVAAPPPQASGGAAAMPTVAEVLAKYVEAIGGPAAIEKITTRLMKGKVEISGDEAVRGTIEIAAKAPNKWVMRISLPEGGAIASGCDGAAAWDLSADYGLRDLAEEELAWAQRNAEFYRELKLSDLYPRMTVQGKQFAGAREAWVVEAAPAKGDPEKLYFDTQTGLLLRKREEVWNPDGKSEFQVDYSDYRAVDGVKLPFVIHRESEDSSMTIHLDDIRQNVPIDDATFAKPAAK